MKLRADDLNHTVNMWHLEHLQSLVANSVRQGAVDLFDQRTRNLTGGVKDCSAGIPGQIVGNMQKSVDFLVFALAIHGHRAFDGQKGVSLRTLEERGILSGIVDDGHDAIFFLSQ